MLRAFGVWESIWSICHIGEYSNIRNPSAERYEQLCNGTVEEWNIIFAAIYYCWRLGVCIHTVFYHLPVIGTYRTHDDVGIRPLRVA